jgi:hypothetical protein
MILATTPLPLALDGEAVILTQVATLEFGPQIWWNLSLVRVVPMFVKPSVSTSVPQTVLVPHQGGSPAALHGPLCW